VIKKFNMNFEERLVSKAVTELLNPSLGVTEQYFEIHDVERLQSIPEPERVTVDEQANLAIVYFKIQGERFRLAVYLQLQPVIIVYNVATENNSRVYLRATSESLSADEIENMTSLQAGEKFSKGDKRTFGKSIYNYSEVIFEPNPEIDTFENKLDKLLSFLEQDNKGVNLLVDQANAYIQADIDIHFGNGLIGGPLISKENISRICALNLAIEFSQFVTGNPFV
jgi:hypothetical protein